MICKASSILVIDYGVGNVGSALNAFKRIGEDAVVKCEAPQIETLDQYSMVVLPGVGSFDRGMENLCERGWTDWLQACLESETAILGLCLGMQLLCEGSDEGSRKGLGFVPGRFHRFTFSDSAEAHLKVPHMGWNFVQFDHERAPWAGDHRQPQRFYFVHSYYRPRQGDSEAVGSTDYGVPFTSAIADGRLIGLQFHPEKSHRYGTDLLRGIVNWARA